MSIHAHHATGYCPYCGTEFDEEIPYSTEFVRCQKCFKLFVAIVRYSTDVRRIEGESHRYSGINAEAIRSYVRAAA